MSGSRLPDLAFLERSLQELFPGRALCRGCDFRPHWNGFLVNLSVTILPGVNEEETRRSIFRVLRDLVRFVFGHQVKFGAEDKVQLIVGWDESVRTTGRQIVKMGLAVREADGVWASLRDENPEAGLSVCLPSSWSQGVVFGPGA